MVLRIEEKRSASGQPCCFLNVQVVRVLHTDYRMEPASWCRQSFPLCWHPSGQFSRERIRGFRSNDSRSRGRLARNVLLPLNLLALAWLATLLPLSTSPYAYANEN